VLFTDGSTEKHNVDYFLGTPGNRMSDAQLSDVFRVAAANLLAPGAADLILDAVWSLDGAPDVRRLTQLARLR
jgi:2-methylcitrate dehydratase PrpD